MVKLLTQSFDMDSSSLFVCTSRRYEADLSVPGASHREAERLT
jgi:hypothetical protein